MEDTKKKKGTPEFQAVQLRLVGPGVWKYRHESESPESLPAAFFQPAKQNYGMREGDCIILVSGKQARLVVV